MVPAIVIHSVIVASHSCTASSLRGGGTTTKQSALQTARGSQYNHQIASFLAMTEERRTTVQVSDTTMLSEEIIAGNIKSPTLTRRKSFTIVK